MAKKKQPEAISWHPDAQTRAMQVELQTWMETHELTHDTKWWPADEFYHGQHLEYDEPPHLVLTFEGDLYNVFTCLWNRPDISTHLSQRCPASSRILNH